VVQADALRKVYDELKSRTESVIREYSALKDELADLTREKDWMATDDTDMGEMSALETMEREYEHTTAEFMASKRYGYGCRSRSLCAWTDGATGALARVSHAPLIRRVTLL
jgi:hypothetical protein